LQLISLRSQRSSAGAGNGDAGEGRVVSTLWDDDWTCIGGPAQLVEGFLRHPDLEVRRVALGEDATPPDHEAI
jgi:hypothetical protein